MIAVNFQRGVELSAHALWLDPHGARPLAFISHAHSDHIGRHAEVIATAATAELMRARLGAKRIEHRMEFGETREFRGLRVTLLPAGHILGSAQFFAESESGSLLYTGDFKLRPGLSCEATEWRHAETLIMETTFGRPRYVMPPAAEVLVFPPGTQKSAVLDAIPKRRTAVLTGWALDSGTRSRYGCAAS